MEKLQLVQIIHKTFHLDMTALIVLVIYLGPNFSNYSLLKNVFNVNGTPPLHQNIDNGNTIDTQH